MMLPRQTTTDSCGPVAVAAAARLQGKGCPLKTLVGEIKPDSVCGAKNEDMFSVASQYLDVSETQKSWHGGLAIANIRNPDSGVGHYVVLLDEQNELIRYYCPLHGKVRSIHREELVWGNGTGTIKDWVINLRPPEHGQPSMVKSLPFVFILGNDPGTLSASLLLKQTYDALGFSAFLVSGAAIALIGTTLYLNGLPVSPDDMVWVRVASGDTPRYSDMLQLLEQVPNVKLLGLLPIKSPGMMRQPGFPLGYNRPLIVSSASSDEIRRGLVHIDWNCDVSGGYVVTALSGGQNRRALTHEEVLAVCAAYMKDSGYVAIEPFARSI